MVTMCELELTNLQQRILRFCFLRAGTTLNAHAIAKALSVSQPAVAKSLPLLQKKEFLLVTKDKETKRFSITLNRENHHVLWLKRADNLKQLYESGLVQYFYDSMPEATIILFGSYAFGEDTMTSDIDIAVIGAGKKSLDTKALALKEFEKKLSREITINSYASFKNIDRHLLNNILNGITLKGAVQL